MIKSNLVLTLEVPMSIPGLKALEHIMHIINGVPGAKVKSDPAKTDPVISKEEQIGIDKAHEDAAGYVAPTPGSTEKPKQDATEVENRNAIRMLLGEKAKAYQKEIRAKLKAVGAKNISTIPVDKLVEILTFLQELK